MYTYVNLIYMYACCIYIYVYINIDMCMWVYISRIYVNIYVYVFLLHSDACISSYRKIYVYDAHTYTNMYICIYLHIDIAVPVLARFPVIGTRLLVGLRGSRGIPLPVELVTLLFIHDVELFNPVVIKVFPGMCQRHTDSNTVHIHLNTYADGSTSHACIYMQCIYIYTGARGIQSTYTYITICACM